MDGSPVYPRFALGKVEITPDAEYLLEENMVNRDEMLYDHRCGDWGDVAKQVWDGNSRSLELGGLVFSVFTLGITRDRIMVITLPDRSKTYVQLTQEI